MKNKYPHGIGPGGFWLIFAGIPMSIIATLLMCTLTEEGNIRGVGEDFLPFVLLIVPMAIIVGCKILYDHFPKRLVIPCGIVGWILNFLILYWLFWPDTGAFGHHN
jgi:hypothetical protein